MEKGRIVYVTLKESGDHIVRHFSYSDSFLYHYIGGRGFNMRILTWTSQNLPKNYYDKSNVICISPGLLSGTGFPSSGRTSIAVLKSPITGFWGEGNFGGYFGPAMKRCGVDSLVIDGKAKNPVAIHVTKDSRIKFEDCTAIWRCGTEATTAVLERGLEYPDRSRKVLCIGQGGANQIFSAVALCDNRTSGGSGTGAVFGSKNLKAVIVDNPEGLTESYESDYMRELSEKVENRIKAHPVFDTFSTYGTTSLVEIHSGLKYFPTKNWLQKTWSKWKKISGKRLLKDHEQYYYDLPTREQEMKDNEVLGCINCPIVCTNLEKIEYETLNCLGSKLGVDDLSWIRSANLVYFNDAGLDVIQTTSVLSALMEMTQDRVIGWDLPSCKRLVFGNTNAINKFLDDLISPPCPSREVSLAYMFKDGFKEGVKQLIQQGLVKTDLSGSANVSELADVLMDEYYPNVKGMGLSGVFPSEKNRASALAVATASRGADHLRSLPTLATYADWYLGAGVTGFKRILKLFTMPIQSLLMMKADTKNLVGNLYQTYKDTFGVPAPIVDEWEKAGFLLDPKITKGWGGMIKFCQEVYAVSDSFGTCRFISPWRFGIGPQIMANAFVGHTGISSSWQDLLKVGERIYALEKSFSQKYGIEVEDNLPKRFIGTQGGKLHSSTFFDMRKDYYEACGYDFGGVPTYQLMRDLLGDTLETMDIKMLKAISFDRRRP